MGHYPSQPICDSSPATPRGDLAIPSAALFMMK